jgi:hypothetical protein
LNTHAVEYITDSEGLLLAIAISHEHQPPDTEFMTTSDLPMQLGFIKYLAEGTIQPHIHLPIERHLIGTGEVLVVRSGKMEALLFDGDRRLVKKKIMTEGDILVLIGGGHGFRMLEDTVLMEVKQGPYTGLQEKERFDYDSGE